MGMNGELEIATSITGTVMGQLLMIAFMVVANWAILAILTAVVSDNMIDSSKKSHEEEEELRKQARLEEHKKRLRELFKEFGDSDGVLTQEEWDTLLSDSRYVRELCEITNVGPDDLRDTFHCLSVEEGDPPKRSMRV